jgi:hypothetical protein
MKTTLLTALALLAATPAWTCGGAWVSGRVTVDRQWITVEDANWKFLIKTNSPLGKRFLKVCPSWSNFDCHVALGDNDNWTRKYTRQHRDGGIIITDWPRDGVWQQCTGTVRVLKEWAEVGDDNCTIDGPLMKRFLKVCPDGSECALYVSSQDYLRAHGGISVVIKWPEFGVEKLSDPKEKQQ